MFQVSWEDLIGEPDHTKTLDCCWKCSGANLICALSQLLAPVNLSWMRNMPMDGEGPPVIPVMPVGAPGTSAILVPCGWWVLI